MQAWKTRQAKDPRPLAVNIALTLLAASFGVAFVMSLFDAQWNNLPSDISFALFLVLNLVPLWFMFCGKNWARWLQAVLIFSGLCLSYHWWSQLHHAFSTFEAVWFWLNDLSDIITVFALFHPSSNQWFQGNPKIMNDADHQLRG